jgi:hypothetical protein
MALSSARLAQQLHGRRGAPARAPAPPAAVATPPAARHRTAAAPPARNRHQAAPAAAAAPPPARNHHKPAAPKNAVPAPAQVAAPLPATVNLHKPVAAPRPKARVTIATPTVPAGTGAVQTLQSVKGVSITGNPDGKIVTFALNDGSFEEIVVESKADLESKVDHLANDIQDLQNQATHLSERIEAIEKVV